MTPAATLHRETAKAEREKWELHLARDLRALGLHPVRQFVIPGPRKFTFDFAFVEQRLLIEVQGAVFVPGKAHSSGTGITRDAEKACYAAIHGWRLMPVTGEHVKKGEAILWIQLALKALTRT